MDRKNIFVVGGSSGIGFEIVKKFRIIRMKFLLDHAPANP